MTCLRSLLFAAFALLVAGCASPSAALPRPLHVVMGPPPSIFPTITPGTASLGSWAPTAVPAGGGTSGDPGFGENPIAMFDDADAIDVNVKHPICVKATSAISFITGVAIAADGGAFQTATYTATPPNSPGDAGPFTTWCAYLDAPNIGDRNREIRAVITQAVGNSMVLQGAARRYTNSLGSLYLATNAHGTMFKETRMVAGPGIGTDNSTCGLTALTACATNGQAIHNLAISGGGDVGGGTICWLANVNAAYDGAAFGTTLTSTNRMMKFTACPGVLPSQVRITSADNSQGVGPDKVEIFGLSWVSSPVSPSSLNGFGRLIFAHDMSYVGAGVGRGQSFITSIGAHYYRDVDVSNVTDGLGNCVLAIRSHFHDSSSDAFSGCYGVFDTPGEASVYNIDPTYTPPGSAAFVTGNIHNGNATIDGIADTSRFTIGAGVLAGPGYTNCMDNPGAGSYAIVSIVTNSSVTLASPVVMSGGLSNCPATILQTGDHPDIWQRSPNHFFYTAPAGSTTITIVSGTPYLGTAITDGGAHVAPLTRVTSISGSTATLSKPTLIDSTNYEVNSGQANVMLYGITTGTWSDTQGFTFDQDMTELAFDRLTINNVLPITGNQESIINAGGNWGNIRWSNLNFTGPFNPIWSGTDFKFENSTCSSNSGGARPGVTYVNADSCKINH